MLCPEQYIEVYLAVAKPFCVQSKTPNFVATKHFIHNQVGFLLIKKLFSVCACITLCVYVHV